MESSKMDFLLLFESKWLQTLREEVEMLLHSVAENLIIKPFHCFISNNEEGLVIIKIYDASPFIHLMEHEELFSGLPQNQDIAATILPDKYRRDRNGEGPLWLTVTAPQKKALETIREIVQPFL